LGASAAANAGFVLERLDAPVDLLALAQANPQIFPCLLESVAEAPATGRWDILFVHEGESIVARAGDGEGFLPRLDRAYGAARVPATASSVPFRGGWVLLLNYELAQECEPRLRLPQPHDGVRAIALRAPAAIVHDRSQARRYLVAETGAEHWIERLRSLCAAPLPSLSPLRLDLTANEDDPQRFLDGVARIHAWLRAGDVFQVNLSRAWRAKLPSGTEPCALYAALRRANPAPFAGLFRHGEFAVLSSSPERLVNVHGRRVETRPIAGTRARAPLAANDGARVRELIANPKERAEHVMLIDLERNDLGRVCVPGSVVVDELMTVESYAHVHHIVSNVRGQLRAGVSPGRVIQAVFPGGTITGCPKVRCMEIIAELEAEARGPYTGALGYLNRDGDLDLNILIRSLRIERSELCLRAGAGIVADSIAERELDETRSKAEGLLRALRGEFA
jgi:anthranilate synthase component 1